MSDNNIKPIRPEPVVPDSDPVPVTKKSDASSIQSTIIDGGYAVIEDQYPTGLKVLAGLKKRIFDRNTGRDFHGYRAQRKAYHFASNRLLLPVRNNEIALPKSPKIGWLKELYPDESDFYLSFPQVQGLNSSWQWYHKGITFPVLDQPVYPYYGTYFPTRFDHLILFDKWLTKYQGRKSTAMDIGTGCGVLAFQMAVHGFEQVYASDINPNAVISVLENVRSMGVSERVTVKMGDLFEPWHQKADLVVFNPPWLPAEEETTLLDKAIYFEAGLYERFFDQAQNHLAEGGKLVILYSNLAQTAGFHNDHPMDLELQNHERFRKVRVIKRKVKQGSKKTRRRRNRKQEYVELWELEKNHHNPVKSG